MKTRLLGLFFLGLTHLISAQNELAMETSQFKDESFTTSAITIQNEQYLNLKYMVAQPLPVRIKTLQKVAADFDIKQASFYSENKGITYTVNFQSNVNYITAIYDTQGIIISSEEHYENVRIPYHLSVELAKDYPGWSFQAIACSLSYDQKSGTVITYAIDLRKENKSKSISLTL